MGQIVKMDLTGTFINQVRNVSQTPKTKRSNRTLDYWSWLDGGSNLELPSILGRLHHYIYLYIYNDSASSDRGVLFENWSLLGHT